MKKKPIKEYIVFSLIVLIAAVSILATAQIGTKKYYPGDDSKLQIVFLGDSNIAYDFEGKTIPHRVAERIECDVYNCAIGGTTAAKINTLNYFDKSFDLLCLYNITKIMETEDHQPLMDFFDEATVNEQLGTGKMQMLVNIKYEEVDYIVISYGLNDYTTGCAVSGEDKYDETTYEGALRNAIEILQKQCPNATIILSSITYCAFYENGEMLEDGYERSWGGGYINDYRDAAKNVASEYENVIFMDNLELLEIDKVNCKEYIHDNMHLNAAGQEKYADCLVEIIKENESSKDDK